MYMRTYQPFATPSVHLPCGTSLAGNQPLLRGTMPSDNFFVGTCTVYYYIMFAIFTDWPQNTKIFTRKH